MDSPYSLSKKVQLLLNLFRQTEETHFSMSLP